MKKFALFCTIFVTLFSELYSLKASSNDSYPKGSDSYFKEAITTTSFILLFVIFNYAISIIPTPPGAPILILAVIFGVVTIYSPTIRDFHIVGSPTTATLIQIYLPILVFKTAFCLDVHIFLKALPQILIISIPVTFINACFVGFLSSFAANVEGWTPETSVLLGVLCVLVYPVEMVHRLEEIGSHTKYTSILLQGESLIGLDIAVATFSYMSAVLEHQMNNWQDHCVIIAHEVFIEPALGLALGIFGRLVMKLTLDDPVNLVGVTLSMPFLGFLINQVLDVTDGALTIIMIGIVMSIERASLSAEMDAFIIHVWRVLAKIMNAIVCLASGLVFATYILLWLELSDAVWILLTFILVNIGRFLFFLLFAPLLSRIGYGFSFKDMIICVWGGLKNPLSMSFAISLLDDLDDDEINLARVIIMQVVAIFFLSLLVNGSLIPVILKVTGHLDLTIIKQSNMSNCLKYIMTRRDQIISVLKMDRFLSDANWPLVNKATEMKHPYESDVSHDEDDTFKYLSIGYSTCPECQTEVLSEPSPKEFKEMIKEARLRVLKTKKISYCRQFETGMISLQAKRTLFQAVEVAMETSKALIEIDGLYKLFKRQGFTDKLRQRIRKFYQKEEDKLLLRPRRKWRRICFNIIMHKAFIIFIYVVIALNAIPIVCEATLSVPGLEDNYGYLGINTVFFLIYVTEFFLKIAGYSVIYWKDGFRTYFTSYWNNLDFIVLLICAADIITSSLGLAVLSYNEDDLWTLHLVLKLLTFLRLLRLLTAASKFCYPSIIKCMDSKMDERKAYAYDVAKGYLTGETEVLSVLHHLIDNFKILEDMRKRLERDRLHISRLLGIAQKERPWIANRVKTKQAIRSVLNNIKETIFELKVSGWVDEVEFSKLSASLNERLDYVRHLKNIPPSTPKEILRNICWMGDDEKVVNFIFENITIKKYDPNDIISAEGKASDGIFIIVTGLLLITYIPRRDTQINIKIRGYLPAVEYLSPERYTETSFEYILPGNSIGEISTLTGKSSDCVVKADTYTHVYFIEQNIIKRAMTLDPDPIKGLQARIWKFVAIRIATPILMEVPPYHSYSLDNMKFAVERAFVPDISLMRVFVMNEMIQDIVLIEGVAVDNDTRDVFIAPCYIPRTSQKLLIQKTSSELFCNDTVTRVLIIPAKDTDEYELMMREMQTCEADAESEQQLSHLSRILRQKRSWKQPRKRKEMRSLKTDQTITAISEFDFNKSRVLLEGSEILRTMGSSESISQSKRKSDSWH